MTPKVQNRMFSPALSFAASPVTDAPQRVSRLNSREQLVLEGLDGLNAPSVPHDPHVQSHRVSGSDADSEDDFSDAHSDIESADEGEPGTKHRGWKQLSTWKNVRARLRSVSVTLPSLRDNRAYNEAASLQLECLQRAYQNAPSSAAPGAPYSPVAGLSPAATACATESVRPSTRPPEVCIESLQQAAAEMEVAALHHQERVGPTQSASQQQADSAETQQMIANLERRHTVRTSSTERLQGFTPSCLFSVGTRRRAPPLNPEAERMAKVIFARWNALKSSTTDAGAVVRPCLEGSAFLGKKPDSNADDTLIAALASVLTGPRAGRQQALAGLLHGHLSDAGIPEPLAAITEDEG